MIRARTIRTAAAAAAAMSSTADGPTLIITLRGRERVFSFTRAAAANSPPTCTHARPRLRRRRRRRIPPARRDQTRATVFRFRRKQLFFYPTSCFHRRFTRFLIRPFERARTHTKYAFSFLLFNFVKTRISFVLNT